VRIAARELGDGPARPNCSDSPGSVEESIRKARQMHSRYGRYFDEIDRLRWHV
jgi:hypothetical protein